MLFLNRILSLQACFCILVFSIIGGVWGGGPKSKRARYSGLNNEGLYNEYLRKIKKQEKIVELVRQFEIPFEHLKNMLRLKQRSQNNGGGSEIKDKLEREGRQFKERFRELHKEFQETYGSLILPSAEIAVKDIKGNPSLVGTNYNTFVSARENYEQTLANFKPWEYREELESWSKNPTPNILENKIKSAMKVFENVGKNMKNVSVGWMKYLSYTFANFEGNYIERKEVSGHNLESAHIFNLNPESESESKFSKAYGELLKYLNE